MGYKKLIGRKSFNNWLKQIDNAVRYGNARSAIRLNHKDRTGTGYTDCNTAAHPTYLHELFRQATSLLGDNASFKELAMAINMNSAARADLPSLNLDR